MKKLIIVYIVLIIVVILLAFMRGGGDLLASIPFIGKSSSAVVEVSGQKYNLLIADSDKERQKGLSGRNKLDDGQGMLFVFEERGRYPFWMKDMKFAIDIIWLDDNRVVFITKNAQPPQGQTPALTVYTPDADANYVLELNAGEADKLKLEKGTTVKFEKLPTK